MMKNNVSAIFIFILVSISFASFKTNRASEVPIELEKLFLNNLTVKELMNSSFIIRDSIYTDYNNDNLIDAIFILEDTARKVPVDEFREQYKEKRLLILMNKNNIDSELTVDISKLFKSEYKGMNWGVDGSDAFSEMKTVDNYIILVFNTGGTTRLNEQYYFYYKKNKWQLLKYKREEYDIMDIDNQGSIRNISINHYNFNDYKKLKYTIKSGTPTDSTLKSFESKIIYLTDFVAWDGIFE